MSFREAHFPNELAPKFQESGGLLSHATAREICYAVIKSAIDQKSLDVRGLDISRLTDIADYFVIASGTSERHVKGIVDRIKLELKKFCNETPHSITGYEQSDWVVMDYGSVVVHIFYEPTRQYYLFDELWQNAEVLPLTPELERDAKMLRTGIYR